MYFGWTSGSFEEGVLEVSWNIFVVEVVVEVEVIVVVVTVVVMVMVGG